MKTISFTSPSPSRFHPHHVPGRKVTAKSSLPVKLRDEHLKTRALQRWENEGGRILPKPHPALH